MLIILIKLSLIALIFASDSYDLPHFELSSYPAKEGYDVQLRCTKIITWLPYSCYRGYDKPGYEEPCYHKWSKDGTDLKQDYVKYKMSSIITFNYCEKFEKTSDMIKSFGPIVDMNTGVNAQSLARKRMKHCYASTLVIRNVQVSDFGTYSCNFTNHNEFGEVKVDVANITLYNEADTSFKPSTGIHYFESFYTRTMTSRFLLQCTVAGGSLEWLFYDTPCNNTTNGGACSVRLVDLESVDMWRSVNVSVMTHSPFPGVWESLLFFDDVSPLDNTLVGCAVQSSKALVEDCNYSRVLDQQRSKEWSWYNRHYSIDIYTSLHLVIIVVPIVVLFISITSIVACVRSGICSRRSSQQVLLIPSHQLSDL